MKRILTIGIGLVLLLSIGCFRIDRIGTPEPTDSGAVQIVRDTPVSDEKPTAGPTDAYGTMAAEFAEETPSHPETGVLPMVFNVYEEVGWYVTEAVMFRYDIDFDGSEEEISFRIDDETYTTIITIDDQSITMEDGDQFMQAILIDLDPSTPYVNLLISIDEASDDYITTELHFVDKQIVVGKRIYDDCAWDAEQQALIFYERTDMLGTASGARVYAGEDLTPVSEWIDVPGPSEEDLLNNRDELIEYGVLLHTVRELPCERNGNPAKLAKDAYVYLVRFNEARDTAVVSTEDGKLVTLHFTVEDWEYSIDGLPVSEYFDNLFYAD